MKRQSGGSGRAFLTTLLTTASVLVWSAPGLCDQQVSAAQGDRAHASVTADIYILGPANPPVGAVNVGANYSVGAYSQHWCTVTLAEDEEAATVAVASELTNGSGDNDEVSVNQENPFGYYGYSDSAVIGRTTTSAQTIAVEAATTAFLYASGGLAVASVGDPHSVIFTALGY